MDSIEKNRNESIQDDVEKLIKIAFAVSILMIAQQVASKAIRDAYFLSVFPPEFLPRVMTAASIGSVVLVFGVAELYKRWPPEKLVPLLFLCNALLYGAEWSLIFVGLKRFAAILMFVHTSSFGAIVISGFWAVMNERFDPHTAKKVIIKVASGATMGGLVGGVVMWQASDKVTIPTLVVVLGGINLFCGAAILKLRRSDQESLDVKKKATNGLLRTAPWQLWEDFPYLRHVTFLVVLLAFGTANIDYVFKAKAAQTYLGEQSLVTFFSLFYLVVGITSFLIQNAIAQRVLRRFGISVAISTLPLVLFCIGGFALLLPTLLSLALLRGGATTLEGSIYRSGYELLYTSVPEYAKRPAKTLIDVGGDKFGAAFGSLFAVFTVGLVPGFGNVVLLMAAVLSGLAAAVVARWLVVGYSKSLTKNLISSRSGSEWLNVLESQIGQEHPEMTSNLKGHTLFSIRKHKARVDKIISGDIDFQVLFHGKSEELDIFIRKHQPLPAAWVCVLIRRLADDVHPVASATLKRVAPMHLGSLADALLEKKMPLFAKIRVLDIMTSTPSSRCMHLLVSLLTVTSLELREKVAYSLAAIARKNEKLKVSPIAVWDLISREVELLQKSFYSPSVDKNKNSIANHRLGMHLAYMFHLLSLVSPSRPLFLALQGLSTSNMRLRGTAKEYLENVLRPDIRDIVIDLLDHKEVATVAEQSWRGVFDVEAVRSPSLMMLKGQLEAG